MQTSKTFPILITGPSRSGKSEWAEHLARQTPQPVIYLATGQENPDDPDWQARINRHRDRRPAEWQTVCVDQDLSAVLQNFPTPACVLVDSLGGWVANCLGLSDIEWQEQQQAFLHTLNSSPLSLIFVAEETGWGVIPAYPLGRLFRDRLGDLIRQTGAQCAQVFLVTGGYALDLSRCGQPLPPRQS